MSDIPASQAPPKVKGICDIVFLMDSTGSMQSVINDLRDNIDNFIKLLDGDGVANQPLVKHWRGKAVGYRDFIWDADKIEDNPFVESADELRAQLNSLEAKGGGDEPESLLEGIMHVAGMDQTDKGLDYSELDPNKWRNRADGVRAVVVFTDASFHEEMEEPHKGGDFMDVATICMDKRIVLQVYCPQMECFDNISEIDKADVFQFPYDKEDEEGAVKALKNFTSDKKIFQETLESLAKTVSVPIETEVL